MPRRARLSCLLVLLWIVGASQIIAAPPNIVVILVDDMGYGDPTCFNPNSKIPTPHIDSLAREGRKFTDAHAPGPLCHMSRYGLITGEYPFRTDVTRWPTEPLVQQDTFTLATLAKRAGYRTAMVGKWHLGFKESGYEHRLPGGPLDCGFDSFFGMRASTDIPPYFYICGDRAVELPTDHIDDQFSDGWSKIQGVRTLSGGIAPSLKLPDVLPRFTDEAIEVISGHPQDAQEPLFLYVALPAPHTPWLPSSEFAGKSSASLYGDFAMMVDAQIGRILQALTDAQMVDDTLVVFTSDNGPCWHPADVERFDHDAVGGLKGMKADAWEGGHRMPFIIRWPGHVAPSSTSEQLVCFTDLMATFASLLGVELPPQAGPDSFDFSPALLMQADSTSTQPTPMREQFVMRAGSAPTMMTIRSGDWKLITQLGSGGFSPPRIVRPGPDDPAGQLYNLAQDLGETTNLYATQPNIVAQLETELRSIMDAGRSRPVSARVDAATLKGKVMCGYQGWFNCEGDGADLGWTHWSRNNRRTMGPGNVTVDLWPDLTEFTEEERFATEFQLADGSPAEVFSSANRATVLRHFQWMQDYGLDGVFLQRFANGLKSGAMLEHKNKVLAHVREGAAQTGRCYALMYDLSGLRGGGVARVYNDWHHLVQTQGMTKDAGYVHHEGKPLVAIWGVGFNDGRKYTLEECQRLIASLKDDGCAIMLGVPTGWREGVRDATNDPLLQEIVAMADIISPWTVGRYQTPSQATNHGEAFWAPDQQWCLQHDIDFLPVAFPGFSWHNLKGAELDAIPRLGGEFLWSQVVAAKQAGCEMLYVAMFDEVDEGTAIFKCTNNTPVGEDIQFLTYEGLPSDHYLKIVGQAARTLRGEIPLRTSFQQ